ncbi:UBC-like protein, partial [Ascodesmis nigricans]
LTHLSTHLLGPSSTPYSSGIYHLTLTIPSTYPTSPPTATFHTKIFHPNICARTGDVCVDTLKRDWNPRLTLRDVLITIRCLLVWPNHESALNEEAARLMAEGEGRFEERARVWAEVHAR